MAAAVYVLALCVAKGCGGGVICVLVLWRYVDAGSALRRLRFCVAALVLWAFLFGRGTAARRWCCMRRR